MPFGKDELTPASYRRVVSKFLGFVEPLEYALGALSLPEGLQFEQRRRSGLLIRDLQSLGITHGDIAALPRCANTPTFAELPEALGVMYVLEGSTLGGQFIAKLVYETLGLTEETGTAFFYSYGVEVGSMWRRFSDIAREEVVAPAAQQQFIAAAQSTFTAFECWIENSRAHSACTVLP